MKSWQVRGWGEPESMTFGEVELPAPGPGQVRIRNRAAGLNFFDILQIQGKYQMKPAFPFTPGAEVSGAVDAVGEGVTGHAVGDSAIALPFQGGMAEYSIAEASRVFPLPAHMSFAKGAGMPVVYQTSHFALLLRAGLKAGEWLLVHAGASGTGTSAIQLGKAMGARVIATAGSEEKLGFCRANGADHALLYSGAGWVDRVKEITGAGADVIYDPVGGDVFDLSTKCIAPYGRLVVIGFASGRIPSVAANRVLLKNMSVVGAFWGGHLHSDADYPARAQEELSQLYAEGKIDPPEPVEYALAEAPRALRDLAERRILGKAVLVAG